MFVILTDHVPHIHISYIVRRITSHKLWPASKNKPCYRIDHMRGDSPEGRAANQEGLKNSDAEQSINVKSSLKFLDASKSTSAGERGLDVGSRSGEPFGADTGPTVQSELGPEFVPVNQCHMEAGDQYITISTKWDSQSLCVYKRSPSARGELTLHGLLSLPATPLCFRHRAKYVLDGS